MNIFRRDAPDAPNPLRTRRAVADLRWGFIGMAALLVVIGTLLLWRSWHTEKDHELLYLSSLVEITGKSLDNYFANHAHLLHDLGQDILDSGYPVTAPETREALQNARRGKFDFLRAALTLPDFTLTITDNAGSDVPARPDGAHDPCDRSLDEIEAGDNFAIGRAELSAHTGIWVIPLCYGVRDANARLAFILSVMLSVERQQSLWQGVSLPPDSALGLIRDDGYIISRYPAPRAIDYPETYGKRRTGRLREYLVENNFPQRGTTEGYNSVTKADYLFAFHRLTTTPLTVFVSTPLANVRVKWLRQAEFSTVLLVFMLGGAYLVFRWSRRQLRAWDAERAAHEREIEFLAQHDLLTGLPNRLLAVDRFQQAVAYAKRERTKVAVMFLDLDNFKSINDSLGHEIGDAVLKEVTTRLSGCLRATDTLSRQGGDEFLAILGNLHEAGSVTRVAEALLAQMNAPLEIDHHQLATTVSIGIAIYPDDGCDFGTLLRKADTSMYNAKAAGRNAYRFYTERMNLDADERLKIRAWLAQALERNWFVLHYQPQFDLGNGEIVGAEALIRLRHPTEGLIPPGRFISIAEDTGLIVPICDWVLREACRQTVLWREKGWPDLVIAVNISAVQLKRGGLEQSVAAALADSGLPAENLELELTESLLIENADNVLATVTRLKKTGLRFSIDDFGTGYSSLAYLKRFSIDRLKIDQSFVRDLLSDTEDSAIVHAVIQMARALDLATLAEGVEDEPTSRLLRDLGCQEGQGYFYARPMAADQFSAFLDRHRQSVTEQP